MMRTAPRVSVVIPTYRRPELLLRCLGAIAEQSLDPLQFELVVADDGPDRDTERAVRSFQQRVGFPVRYVPVRRTQGPAGARNAGWHAARGAIIAFTDDDTIPDKRWLEEGLRAFDDAAVAALWGEIVVPLPDDPSDYERDAAGLAQAEFATANCFCRRAVLQGVGGFDERFTAAWREDSDLYFSILEHGHRVIHEPWARVIHPVRKASWGVSLWQQQKSQFNALLYKKHPRLYWQKIQPHPPWNYYGILITLLAAMVGLLLGSTVMSLCALAFWLLLTARFLYRRLRHTSRSLPHVTEMICTSFAIPLLSVYWRLRGAFRFKVLFL